jgi:hypothetical protein
MKHMIIRSIGPNWHRRSLLIGLEALLILLLALTISVDAASASTTVGGPIISNTTWTLAGSPYVVTSNVQVMAGVTLTIEAGTTVKFETDKLLQVDGTLIARGTSINPITFTSNRVSPSPGDWANIKFTNSSTDASFDGSGLYMAGSVLQHCVIEYAGNVYLGGVVETSNASPLLDNCLIRDNWGAVSCGPTVHP